VRRRGLWERESDYWTSRSWGSSYRSIRRPRYDADATGRVGIEIAGFNREGRPGIFADRKSWTLESKLPELFRELEIRAVEDEQQAIEARRRAEERKRQWELAMQRAKDRYAEAFRARALQAQVGAWHEAKRATAYLEALEEAYGDQPEAAEWITWIRSHLATADPLQAMPQLPDVPEAKPDDLNRISAA
jgi:hypothetical protein